jgi:hypothetical protein
VGRFGDSAPNQLQGCQMSKYLTGYSLHCKNQAATYDYFVFNLSLSYAYLDTRKQIAWRHIFINHFSIFFKSMSPTKVTDLLHDRLCKQGISWGGGAFITINGCRGVTLLLSPNLGGPSKTSKVSCAIL